MHLTKCIKQQLTKLKTRINKSKIIVEDSTTSPSVMDRTIKQKTSKKMEGMNNTINQCPSTHLPIGHFTQQQITVLLKCTWYILQDRSHVRL